MALRFPFSGYGLEPDERQTAALHCGAYRALGPVLIALFAGSLYGHFTSNEELSMSMTVIFLIGINIFGYHVEKSGWEDHKREAIAGNPRLRRRALWSIVISGLLGGILTAAQAYFPKQEQLGSALVDGAIFAVFLMGLFWWMDVRKSRGRRIEESR